METKQAEYQPFSRLAGGEETDKLVWGNIFDKGYFVEVHRILDIPPEARQRAELLTGMVAVSFDTSNPLERPVIVSKVKDYREVDLRHYCGELFIFESEFPHRMLHRHVVFLSYQAALGPDKDDIDLWKALCECLADERMKEFYASHPEMKGMTVESLVSELQAKNEMVRLLSKDELDAIEKSTLVEKIVLHTRH